MKLFLIKVFKFLFSFILIFIALFYMIPVFTNQKQQIYDDDFLKKIHDIEKFIEKRDNVNLIIGSSYMTGINTEEFGESWVKFAIGGQNIYDTYKLINYVLKKTKIDTIIYGVNPFDFSSSHQNYNIMRHGNSSYFGLDSITSIDFFNRVQKTKDNIYRFKIFKPDSLIQKDYLEYRLKIRERLHTYKFNLTELDADEDLFLVGNDSVNHHKNYFRGVKKQPNMDKFDKFHELIKDKHIVLICFTSPKSIYWREGLKVLDLESRWNIVKKNIKNRGIIFIDLEDVFAEDVPDNIFINEDHLTEIGHMFFSDLILKNIKEL